MITQLNIQCFVVVARCMSISHAAEQLYMSRQGVSQQIKALEESVGTPLFERQPNKIVLTTAGKYYLEVFTGFFDRLEDLRSRYTEVHKGAMPVRIGIMRTLSTWDEIYKTERLCREAGPEAEVQVNVYEPPELADRLQEKSLDIVFSMPLALMRQPQNYGSFLWVYLPQVMLIQKGHPITKVSGDVCDEALKVLPVASWSREAAQIGHYKSFVANWHKSGREIQQVKNFPNADTAAVAAEAGLCVIICPISCRYLASSGLEIFDLRKKLDYYCIWNKNYENPCVKFFVEHLNQVYLEKIAPDIADEKERTPW